jgi:hypothetical protein
MRRSKVFFNEKGTVLFIIVCKMLLILGTHKTGVGTPSLEGRNMLKDATIFLFLHDALLVPGNIVLDPACIEQLIFGHTTKET